MHFVIFDIDGTLGDTKKVDDRCFVKAFNQTFGLNIAGQNWADIQNFTDWGITEEIIKTTFGRLPTNMEFELMISNLEKELLIQRQNDCTQFSEVPGAKNYFQKLLQQKNVEVGIATGAWRKSAHIKLEAINLPFQNVPLATSDDHKSREGITKNAIREMTMKSSKEPSQITYFGDGIWDYRTCKNLNIDFIGIDIEGDEILKGLGADKVFRNYHEIDKLNLF